MHVTHRKRFVSRDLVALAARRPQELAALSEAHYHDQIESIADEVLAAGQRIVMLTGPSAAGKTTSAHKIADAIAACGHRSQVISLDDFYIGEGKYPKNPDGSDDYESLEALDLERLHACLKASRFNWLFLIARKKPSSAAEIFRQLLQNTKQRFWKWNLTMGILGLGRLNDNFCVTISTRDPSHCSLDCHSSF